MWESIYQLSWTLLGQYAAGVLLVEEMRNIEWVAPFSQGYIQLYWTRKHINFAHAHTQPQQEIMDGCQHLILENGFQKRLKSFESFGFAFVIYQVGCSR